MTTPTPTTEYHYHFIWLPGPDYLREHPIPCDYERCAEGQVIGENEFGHDAYLGECPVCHGYGTDPEPLCGDCGRPMYPLTGPVGALVVAEHKRPTQFRWDQFTYLLCGECAYAELVSEDGTAQLTGDPPTLEVTP